MQIVVNSINISDSRFPSSFSFSMSYCYFFLSSQALGFIQFNVKVNIFTDLEDFKSVCWLNVYRINEFQYFMLDTICRLYPCCSLFVHMYEIHPSLIVNKFSFLPIANQPDFGIPPPLTSHFPHTKSFFLSVAVAGEA